MTAFSVVLAFVVGLCLSGCSGTTLILLPDESGNVGAITVRTQGDIRVIDKAFHSVIAREGTSSLSKTQPLSEAQVNQEYADLLKAQPTNPFSFILYFVTGSSDLVKDSLAIIPKVIDRIKAQMPTEISIIGHTDTTGYYSLNDKLSLKRARTIEKILKDSMPSLHEVNVFFFGSKNLLVPTPPNIHEPRNRRVEILVL